MNTHPLMLLLIGIIFLRDVLRLIQVGGEEFFNGLKNGETPMGLLNHFHDEGEMTMSTFEDADTEITGDHVNKNLEERLEKLNNYTKTS